MKENPSMAIFFISVLNACHCTCFFLGYDLLNSKLIFVFLKSFYVWTVMSYYSLLLLKCFFFLVIFCELSIISLSEEP